MNKIMNRMSKKVAQPPGTLIHTGDQIIGSVSINVIHYHNNIFEEKDVTAIDQLSWKRETKGVYWINVCGIHDISIIENLGNKFNIHPLVQEDILNTHHRPKFEVYEDFFFVVLKMLQYDEEIREIKSEQVSLILGSNFVITFQERKGDVFDPVRERLRNAKSRIRKSGVDYLLYSLIDSVVDNYFLVLESIGESLEALEDRLLEEPNPDVLHGLHGLKREMIFLRKSVWPLREIINGLQKSESPLIKKATTLYLRDIYDHTVQVIETVETYRDLVSGLQDLYLSGVSNKMNEVMKVLTIIATIFIPLTFIAGIYGMNFEFMPELKWKFGYFFVWGIMIVIGIGMYIYFRRKKWL